MRAIACWPIQYLTAFGIASQSPGYLPKAVYISGPDDEEEDRRPRRSARMRARTQRSRRRRPPPRPRARAATQAAHEAPEPVGDEEHARHVGVFLGDAREARTRGRERQPLRAVGLEEALEGEDRREREDERVEVLADEPREVRQVRRESGRAPRRRRPRACRSSAAAARRRRSGSGRRRAGISRAVVSDAPTIL